MRQQLERELEFDVEHEIYMRNLTGAGAMKVRRRSMLIPALAFMFIGIVMIVLITTVFFSITGADTYFQYKDTVTTGKATYDIEYVCNKTDLGEPIKFEVLFNGGIADARKTVTNFKTKKEDGKIIYSFTIDIEGTDWKLVSTIQEVSMFVSGATYKAEVVDDELFIVTWVFVGVGVLFLIISAIFFAIVAKYSKQIKKEIAANPAPAVVNLEVGQTLGDSTSVPQETLAGVICAYCGTLNDYGTANCKNCHAPLK